LLAGKPLPEIEVELLGGGSATNTDFEGRYLLLHMWATTYGPCKAEMPHLHRAYELYHDRGLEILSFSFDDAPEDVEEYNWAGGEGGSGHTR
jgi:thiol-disulfide isomerase/thioredoxin